MNVSLRRRDVPDRNGEVSVGNFTGRSRDGTTLRLPNSSLWKVKMKTTVTVYATARVERGMGWDKVGSLRGLRGRGRTRVPRTDGKGPTVVSGRTDLPTWTNDPSHK